ncbi:monoamine oxidase [Kibdelosporangium banguiense]|uniref:Monoamine oxidase n=1 Tax=Kibdelosporangium banguiense TaxID=1365924 RepID=A0ABS4TZ31_9PSEU|nr:NAD(P)/FAD-dependent oxidoreductase [Kibdelosporangium banguiense]MBP2329214.1 monoamine oxidase [Kibdelosporangium banguiense]
MTTTDVAVVGAGFAGLVAARELGWLGRSALVLEARDRIGGRALTEHRWGSNLELGGTYVHWYQAHIWAELDRYQLTVKPGAAVAEIAYWIAGGRLHSGTFEELRDFAGDRVRDVMRSSVKYLPRPTSALGSERIRTVDDESVVQHLDRIGLTGAERDLLEGLIATDFSGLPAEGAMSQAFRWWAFSSGDWDVHFDVAGGYKIVEGTSELARRMRHDITAEVRLGAVVTRVEQDENGVSISTADGEIVRSQHAIVTVPLSVLGSIVFSPDLNPAKRAMIAEGQMSRGTKVWARLRGELRPFLAIAPPTEIFTMCQAEYSRPGETIVACFGPDGGRIDPEDRAGVESAIRLWLPDAEVISSFGHDWCADEYSRETWPMLRPGQLTKHFDGLRAPEGRVHMAGSIYSDGWGSFIDGALETGISAARRIDEQLR